MMVTSSRGAVGIFESTTCDLPKSPLSSAKRPKKSRRLKKQLEVSEEKPQTLSQHTDHCLSVEDEFIPPSSLSTHQMYSFYPPSNSFSTRYQTFYHLIQEKLYASLCQENLLHVDNEHLLAVNSQLDDKIDSALRTETLSKLWSLHSAYYSLSSLTFCKAVCLMDLLIIKVRVKPKYAMCVAAACYYITSKFERSSDHILPTPESLVTLSRCGGTAGDLTRMVEIILTKLGPSNVAAIGACSATAIDFLSIFSPLGTSSPHQTTDLENHNVWLPPLPISLCRQVEIALISSEVSCFRPACLALALLSQRCFDSNIRPTESSDDDWLQFHTTDLFNLAVLCNVPWADVGACSSLLKVALKTTSESYTVQDYPSSRLLGSSPPLVWTLSRRTQRSISTSSPPTLSTISEKDEELVQLENTLTSVNLSFEKIC
uniref:Cyclin N-terminal domain-containing protein n=1 Tax=Trichobilharzia regenti TaxID=157069 RepID=A0AA85IKV8_TRIRE|nr:unnamed protein product [Trichobilharzia regenti]